MTTTLEKCGMTGFGGAVVGEGTGTGVQRGAGVDVCCGTGVTVAFGVVGAGPAGIAPPAAGDGDRGAIDDAGLRDPGMAAPREPGAERAGAGVATVGCDGVTIARVSVGKGAPHATSTRVQPNVRGARTRLLKPTVSYRRAGLSHAVQLSMLPVEQWRCMERSGKRCCYS
ncbi:MAG TPA: hypothetical protein VN986_04980 [Actinomycetota bacterium]|nr:hypothetical protein [Actinomycetota bacterium]